MLNRSAARSGRRLGRRIGERPEHEHAGEREHEAFADDLRRYLDGHPVQARPDSLRYRMGKFVRRNAVAVGATGLLMLVARRRKLLDYLKRTASDRYKNVIEKLNLRK